MKGLRWLALVILAMPMAALAQEPKIEKLSDHAYAYIAGPGRTNSGFIVTDEGVVVVDAQDTVVHAEEFIAEIRKVSNKPILYVVNTNFHFNHVTGNQLMFSEAKAIIGHEQTRKNVLERGQEELSSMKQNYALQVEQYEKSIRDEAMSDADRTATEQRLADARKSLTGLDRTQLTPPTMTMTVDSLYIYRSGDAAAKATDKASNANNLAFEAKGSLHSYAGGPLTHDMAFGDPSGKAEIGMLRLWLGGLEIQVLHLGRGHTDGDLMVYVPADKVLYAGGMLFAQTLPWLRGSYINEWQATLEKALALDVEKVVPGTGEMSTKDDVLAFKAYLTDLYTAVKNQWDQGVPKDDVRWKIDLSAYQNWANYDLLRYNIEDAFDELEAGRKGAGGN